MGGKCESDKEQSIGCQQTQKMDSAIREPQKNYLSFLVWIITGICLLALLIGGLFVYRTFWPNSYPKEIRMDVRVDGEETSKRLPLNTFLWIWPDIQVDLGASVSEETKAKIKLELSEALLAMEARAAAAYNEKFATLLTILTIFGIAWPVIIALLQFKFNESELKKIENAQNNAAESLIQAREAQNNAAESLIQASEAREKAEESLKQANAAKDNAAKSLSAVAEANMRIYRYNGDVYYQLATSEAENSNLDQIDNSKKVDLICKFTFSIDSYIRATLAVKDDNACRRTVYTKINNMCDWINKITPNLKSQFLVHEFDFLLSFFDDIPDSGKEKAKIKDRLQQIRNDLAEDYPEPEIFDPDEKH